MLLPLLQFILFFCLGHNLIGLDASKVMTQTESVTYDPTLRRYGTDLFQGMRGADPTLPRYGTDPVEQLHQYL